MSLHLCTNQQCPDKSRNPNNRHRTPWCPYLPADDLMRNVTAAPHAGGMLKPPALNNPFEVTVGLLKDLPLDDASALIPVKDLGIRDAVVEVEPIEGVHDQTFPATHLLVDINYSQGTQGSRTPLSGQTGPGYYLNTSLVSVTDYGNIEVGESTSSLLMSGRTRETARQYGDGGKLTPELIKEMVESLESYQPAEVVSLDPDQGELW